MTVEEIKNSLKKNGVKNLKTFGYPNVDTENIMTDEIYGGFFKNMLNENIGHSPKIDKAIEELLKELKEKGI